MPDLAPVDLVGLHGGTCYGDRAARALLDATVVIGSARHLAALPPGPGPATIELSGDLARVLDRVEQERGEGARVVILASGDPGFFGLGRLAAARFGPDGVRIHPSPSSVALAFARAGTHWDDALVVSAHGRDPATALEAVGHHPKVAVLCSPDVAPEELGRRLLAAGDPGARSVVVATRLGEAGEAVWWGDVTALAAGAFDPMSVVLFLTPAGSGGAAESGGPGRVWGRPESEYQHRAGMITKAEVRAVALGKLGLPAAGVMWDVGAGSGSVAAECAALSPGMSIFAVERRADALAGLRANLAGSAVTVVSGEAPTALGRLPDPDRAFVGGGGPAVLDAVWGRLRPGGTVVATYASLERAAAAAGRLGALVQVSVSRGVPTGPGGPLRLQAENPVFVCWGSRRS